MPERLNRFSVAARVPDFADSVANLVYAASADRDGERDIKNGLVQNRLERPLRARRAVAGVVSEILTRAQLAVRH